jgi:hypothetical protein
MIVNLRMRLLSKLPSSSKLGFCIRTNLPNETDVDIRMVRGRTVTNTLSFVFTLFSKQPPKTRKGFGFGRLVSPPNNSSFQKLRLTLRTDWSLVISE